MSDPVAHCTLWLAAPNAGDVALLDDAEVARWHRLHRGADRARLATGIRLLRVAARAVTGDAAVRVTRHCVTCGSASHGRPEIAGYADTCGISLSHSADLVAVAVGPPGLGVDVEQLGTISPDAAHLMCAPEELAADLDAATLGPGYLGAVAVVGSGSVDVSVCRVNGLVALADRVCATADFG